MYHPRSPPSLKTRDVRQCHGQRLHHRSHSRSHNRQSRRSHPAHHRHLIPELARRPYPAPAFQSRSQRAALYRINRRPRRREHQERAKPERQAFQSACPSSVGARHRNPAYRILLFQSQNGRILNRPKPANRPERHGRQQDQCIGCLYDKAFATHTGRSPK